MSKIIRNTHISGEAGVIQFAEYCNKHEPYIIFREVVKNDFGIDGEIELTRTNEDKKVEPTGEIIKIQIKSVSSDSSYIRKETVNQFEFYPRKEDWEYWSKYKQNGIDVLLVIYDQRKDVLYCKKVDTIDVYIAKESFKTQKKKNLNPIIFDKTTNKLNIGESTFTQKFSSNFRNRVSYDVQENLLSNFLKIKQHPKLLHQYQTVHKSKKTIYELITDDEAPYFVVNGEHIYTFFELGKEYKSFKDKILIDDKPKTILYSDLVNNAVLRRHYIELINEHLKPFLRRNKMAYSKEYKRYFFSNYENLSEIVVPVTTRKRGSYSEKTVVKLYNYGKLSFYRHLAVEFSYQLIDDDLFIVLIPKYIFTEDGKKTLSPKLITKLTNFLTSREYNTQYCDSLHFWWSFLSKGNNEILIYEHPAYKTLKAPPTNTFITKHTRISVSHYCNFPVEFGIITDQKTRKVKAEATSITAGKLF